MNVVLFKNKNVPSLTLFARLHSFTLTENVYVLDSNNILTIPTGGYFKFTYKRRIYT